LLLLFDIGLSVGARRGRQVGKIFGPNPQKAQDRETPVSAPPTTLFGITAFGIVALRIVMGPRWI